MFVLNLVFTVLATVSQLLGPKFIQIGIDRYLTDFTSAQAATTGILVVSVIYLGNLLLGWVLSVAQVKSAIAVGQGAMNDLRLAVFEHIQRLSLELFRQDPPGPHHRRADRDIDSLDRIMTWGANQMLASLLTLLGVIGLMLQYDWRLVPGGERGAAAAVRRHAAFSCSRTCALIAKCASKPRASPPRWRRTSPACAWCRRSPARRKTSTASSRCTRRYNERVARRGAGLPHLHAVSSG